MLVPSARTCRIMLFEVRSLDLLILVVDKNVSSLCQLINGALKGLDKQAHARASQSDFTLIAPMRDQAEYSVVSLQIFCTCRQLLSHALFAPQ